MSDAPQPSAAQIARDDGTLDGGAILRLLDRPLPAEDLRAATDRVAQPLEPPQQDTLRLLLFALGSEQLAVPGLAASRVVPTTSVHAVPHRSNRIFRGLCNIDGELMLCGDLRQLLGMPSDEPELEAVTETTERRLIVLGPPSNQWAVEVTAVNRVISVAPASLRQPPVTVTAALASFTTHVVPLAPSAAVERGQHTVSVAGRQSEPCARPLPSQVALLDVDKTVSAFQAAIS